jgi:hypothetical protein
MGDRSFPVAAACAWNALPDSVTSAPLLTAFCQSLNMHLFRRATTALPFNPCHNYFMIGFLLRGSVTKQRKKDILMLGVMCRA